MELAAIAKDLLAVLGSAPLRAQEGQEGGEGEAISFGELVALALKGQDAPSGDEGEGPPSPSGDGSVGGKELEAIALGEGAGAVQALGLLGAFPSSVALSARDFLLPKEELRLEPSAGGEGDGVEGLALPGGGGFVLVDGATAPEAQDVPLEPAATNSPEGLPRGDLRAVADPFALERLAMAKGPDESLEVEPDPVPKAASSPRGHPSPGAEVGAKAVLGDLEGRLGARSSGGLGEEGGFEAPLGRPLSGEGADVPGGGADLRPGSDLRGFVSPGGVDLTSSGGAPSGEARSPLSAGASPDGGSGFPLGVKSPAEAGTSSAPEGEVSSKPHRRPPSGFAPLEGALQPPSSASSSPRVQGGDGAFPQGVEGRLRFREILGRMPLGAKALYALRELPEGAVGGIEGALRMVISASRGFARLKVWPPSLGEMELKVEVLGDRVEASVGVKSRVAYEHLSSRLDGLVGSLKEAGFGEVKVSLNLLGEGEGSSGDAPSGRGGRSYPFGLMGKSPSVETSGEEELHLLGVVSSGFCSVEVWA